jgi:hypothetical protein
MNNRERMTFSRRPRLCEINCLHRKYVMCCESFTSVGESPTWGLSEYERIYTFWNRNHLLQKCRFKKASNLTTFKGDSCAVSDRRFFAYISQLQWHREFYLRKNKIISFVEGQLRNPLKLGCYLRSATSFDLKYSARWQQNLFVNFTWFSK